RREVYPGVRQADKRAEGKIRHTAINKGMRDKLEEVMMRIKRVYAPSVKADGCRFLVERLWPRGVRKEKLELATWLKDVAPSAELRKWFGHDPARWKEFQRRYWAELDEHPEAWQPILEVQNKGCVTLLFSSHDAAHNNVVALKAYLETK